VVAKQSTLRDYPANAVGGHSHVDALSAALAAFGTAARKAIDQGNELGDRDPLMGHDFCLSTNRLRQISIMADPQKIGGIVGPMAFSPSLNARRDGLLV
jgi:hypothetical protein